jgi:hypothetical protein
MVKYVVFGITAQYTAALNNYIYIYSNSEAKF